MLKKYMVFFEFVAVDASGVKTVARGDVCITCDAPLRSELLAERDIERIRVAAIEHLQKTTEKQITGLTFLAPFMELALG